MSRWKLLKGTILIMNALVKLLTTLIAQVYDGEPAMMMMMAITRQDVYDLGDFAFTHRIVIMMTKYQMLVASIPNNIKRLVLQRIDREIVHVLTTVGRMLIRYKVSWYIHHIMYINLVMDCSLSVCSSFGHYYSSAWYEIIQCDTFATLLSFPDCT